MKKRVDWWNLSNKAIYASAFIILVFAFAISLQGPAEISEEQPLGAPSIARGEVVTRGEGTQIKEFQVIAKSDITSSSISLKGTFYYSPTGNLFDCSIQSEGSILGLDAQRLLKKTKSQYLANLRTSGATTTQLIQADNAWRGIATEAKNAWRYKKFLMGLNEGGYKESPEAGCIEKGLNNIIAKTESVHGDVFKEQLLTVKDERPAIREITQAPLIRLLLSLFPSEELSAEESRYRPGEITDIPLEMKKWEYELGTEREFKISKSNRKVIKMPGRKRGSFFGGKEFIVPLNEEDYFREIEMDGVQDLSIVQRMKATIKLRKATEDFSEYLIFTEIREILKKNTYGSKTQIDDLERGFIISVQYTEFKI